MMSPDHDSTLHKSHVHTLVTHLTHCAHTCTCLQHMKHMKTLSMTHQDTLDTLCRHAGHIWNTVYTSATPRDTTEHCGRDGRCRQSSASRLTSNSHNLGLHDQDRKLWTFVKSCCDILFPSQCMWKFYRNRCPPHLARGVHQFIKTRRTCGLNATLFWVVILIL